MTERTPTAKTPTAKTLTAWILVGLAGLASVAGILTIGVFTMPLVYAGAILLLVRPDRTRGLAIVLCGLAFGPLLVTWLNREGPGQVCRSYPPDGVACGTQLNPLPWLGGAAASLAIATVLFLHARRRDATEKSGST
ncbi:MAG: hypothetical protein ACYDDU_08770 [Dermatophilaceae bacterium]